MVSKICQRCKKRIKHRHRKTHTRLRKFSHGGVIENLLDLPPNYCKTCRKLEISLFYLHMKKINPDNYVSEMVSPRYGPIMPIYCIDDLKKRNSELEFPDWLKDVKTNR